MAEAMFCLAKQEQPNNHPQKTVQRDCYFKGGRKSAVGCHGLTRALRSCRYMPKSPDNLFGTAIKLISALFQCEEITQIRENRTYV